MNIKKKYPIDQDHLKILIEIDKKSDVTQREMAKFLGISLGKLNFCILELKKKGLIKIKNFKKSENKFKYAYILTPAGFSAKVKLTLSFMKRKMKEYDYLKAQLKKSQKEMKK